MYGFVQKYGCNFFFCASTNVPDVNCRTSFDQLQTGTDCFIRESLKHTMVRLVVVTDFGSTSYIGNDYRYLNNSYNVDSSCLFISSCKNIPELIEEVTSPSLLLFRRHRGKKRIFCCWIRQLRQHEPKPSNKVPLLLPI